MRLKLGEQAMFPELAVQLAPGNPQSPGGQHLVLVVLVDPALVGGEEAGASLHPLGAQHEGRGHAPAVGQNRNPFPLPAGPLFVNKQLF